MKQDKKNKLSQPAPVVYTNNARCRDCYRCLRVCPVKAIQMKDGQAHVDPDRCIACGTCIRNCPQQAKQYRQDINRTVALLRSDCYVAASVAPSIAAAFPGWQLNRVISALRQIGFDYVAETAVGAYYVAQETANAYSNTKDHPSICSACPALVRYIEYYRPEQVEQIVPIASPMIVHARMLKQQHGPNTKVVFIGPCIAKKAEADRSELAGVVDSVITFEELNSLFEQEEIDLKTFEESAFDDRPAGGARLFPLEGGSLKTADLMGDISESVISVSGFENINDALDSVKGVSEQMLIEPLFCPQGCINGPAMGEGNVYRRRSDILSYVKSKPHESVIVDINSSLISAVFNAVQKTPDKLVTEEQIRQFLESTGKSKLEDQLNCGACGYTSCREKAIAALQGMAEPEMCIPYMRRLAEQRTDRIIDTSPNGIVIVDEKLDIIKMNPSFQKMFSCSDAFIGKQISTLMDPEFFEKLLSGENLVEANVKHRNDTLLCHEILYPLREENQYVGIFVNITNNRNSQHKLDQLRMQTIMQAQELLAHQVEMAQKIAVFLGQSTAQGEQLVDNLMKLTQDESNIPVNKKPNIWDMYTSK